MLGSKDRSVQLEGAIGFRKLLSAEKLPPIDEAIDSGAVPALLALLEISDPELQLEATWAITNIASGTSHHTRVIHI